ncbi:hypothetical protein CDD83_5384 [Cordyceps sp. RAO-2017]|nr:hypothetical protein CDD83_5384 [Cordyceps sp. RAO-2017]
MGGLPRPLLAGRGDVATAPAADLLGRGIPGSSGGAPASRPRNSVGVHRAARRALRRGARTSGTSEERSGSGGGASASGEARESDGHP